MRYIYQSTFKDQNGAVVGSSTTSDGNPGTITVYLAGTDTLASVYAAAVGGVAVNSVSTDAYGYFYFWVDDTDYTVIDQGFKIVLTHPDFLTRTYDNIFINGISTTYLQAFINDNPPTVNFIQTGTGAITRTIQEKAKEVFSAGDFSSLAVAVDALDVAGGGRLNVIGATYTVIDDLSIPSGVEINVWNDALIDIGSGKTLSFAVGSKFTCGIYQAFTGSGTVTFGVGSVVEIYPDWWGTVPNGNTDGIYDTAILNKAIAASATTGDTAGDDTRFPTIVVSPGKYYIVPDGLSAIKCNFHAPNAWFISSTTGDDYKVILPFDYSTTGTNAANLRRVSLGIVLDRNHVVDATHYGVGISITAGDSMVEWNIGMILGFKIGLSLNSDVDEHHIGVNTFTINTILGCDIGIYLQPGQSIGSECEANTFNINYISWSKVAAYLYSVADDRPCCSNVFNVGVLELHCFDNQQGFHVSGPLTFSNIFRVSGGLTPPSGATGYLVAMSDSATENIFELSYIDFTKILNATGGYNIFRQDGKSNTTYPAAWTNSFGRSTIMLDAAPTVLPWRAGDKCWNDSPGDGTLGWVNYSAGTPGDWIKFGGVYFEGSEVWNPGSIAALGYEQNDITVNGAALGDFAMASFSISTALLHIDAQVVSDNTVSVQLFNPTAGEINLGSGTMYVRVYKR